jgi:hypothetical protein
MPITPSRTSSHRCSERFDCTDIKENAGKSIANVAQELAAQLVAAFDIEAKQTRFTPSDRQSRGPEKMDARGHSRAGRGA